MQLCAICNIHNEHNHSVRLCACDVNLKISDNVIWQNLWKTGNVLFVKPGLEFSSSSKSSYEIFSARYRQQRISYRISITISSIAGHRGTSKLKRSRDSVHWNGLSYAITCHDLPTYRPTKNLKSPISLILEGRPEIYKMRWFEVRRGHFSIDHIRRAIRFPLYYVSFL